MFIDTLQQTVEDIKRNQKEEEDKVNAFYSSYIQLLEDKKNDLLENIKKHYTNNKDKISKKLNFCTKKMEDTENVKSLLTDQPSDPNSMLNALKSYNDLYKRHFEQKTSFCELIHFRFVGEDESKVFRTVNNNADLYTKSKNINFLNPKSAKELFSSFEPSKKPYKSEFSPPRGDTQVGGGFNSSLLGNYGAGTGTGTGTGGGPVVFSENRNEAYPRKYNETFYSSDKFAEFDVNKLKMDLGTPYGKSSYSKINKLNIKESRNIDYGLTRSKDSYNVGSLGK